MKDQPSPISDSTDEGFSQRPSHTRLFKKAEKSLPRSPRKRNAVVSNSAKKFQLRIQLIKQKNCCSILFYSILPQHSQSNGGQPKQDLDADEKS